MKLPLFWIDAFTARVFGGNPAAVVPLATWFDDAELQRIAFENGLSETAFFVRKGPARFQLRWFTPKVEVDLCGHATLATAHVLFHELGETGERLRFESRSGELTVTRCSDGRLELDFPSRPAQSCDAPANLSDGLGAKPATVLRNERLWLCVYGEADIVRALRPDFAALSRGISQPVIVTAPGADCDFVSRFFAPGIGIDEDPVTGSAHCTLMPYWAARLGRAELHARQISARGGELWCTLAGDRVRIAGESVLYLRGEISI